MTRIVFLNGDYVPADQARISFFDRAVSFCDAIYEVAGVRGFPCSSPFCWRELSQSKQVAEPITNNRAYDRSTPPEGANSLQITVETGKLGAAEAKAVSPITTRTAKKMPPLRASRPKSSRAASNPTPSAR